MESEELVSRLKRRLLIERIVFGAIILAFATSFIVGKFHGGKSMIVVDGKPVVCVKSEKDAHYILEEIKQASGANPLETEFKEDVVIARAPRNASAIPTSRAMLVAREAISPTITRWAILADGKPVVGLPSRSVAAKTLETIKAKFGSQVKNLAEEPQIRENVSINKAAISPEQYQETPEKAVEYLFKPREAVHKDATYTVKEGDVATAIAKKLGISIKELKKINPNINLDHLAIGDTLNVKEALKPQFPLTVIVRDQSKRTETIPPPIVRVSSASMFSGKMAELTPGSAGKKTVDAVVIYENGKKVGEEVINEDVMREPSPRKIAIGIRPRP